jgi:pimeloyl-ACP methyl ester carboxylesterase
LPEVNVPTSVIRTTQDRVVSPDRQAVLAQLIPGAHEYTLDANHDAVYARADEFVPLLVNACLVVHNEALARTDSKANFA